MNCSINQQYGTLYGNPPAKISFGAGRQYRTIRFYDYENNCEVVHKVPVQKDKFERGQTSNTEKRTQTTVKNQTKNPQRIYKQRIAAVIAALTIAAGGAAAGNIPNGEAVTKENKENIQTVTVIEAEGADTDINTGTDAVLEFEEEYITPSAEAEEAYKEISQSLKTYSSDMGENGYALIKERVDLLGGGEVEVIDVLKILTIESNGRVYDSSGNIIESYTGEAFGPFQLTPDTVDYLNMYFGLEGTENELDVMNPYDNLDACIYNLKFLKEKKENELSENGIFATGNDDLTEAVFWAYHDGAWATEVSEEGRAYIEKYERLSLIDDYPILLASLADTFLA